jgi:hypothetical protein
MGGKGKRDNLPIETMTIREQLAAMALQGLLAQKGASKTEDFKLLPKQAIKMADRLLAGLELDPEELAMRLEKGLE